MFYTGTMRSVVHGIGGVVVVALLCLAGVSETADPKSSPAAEYEHFSPSLALTMTGIIVALFFLVFLFAVYVRYCDEGHISISGSILSLGRPAPRGVERSVIESFPTFLYSAVKELKMGKASLECAVCISEFHDHDTLRLIPACDHVFHPDCIDAWLLSHSTCPVCRADLHSPPSPPHQVQVVEVPPVVMNMNMGESRVNHHHGKTLFPRSQSESERFRLRVPAEVRRQIMKNRQLQRANSMVALPTEGSSRRGYRRLDRDHLTKSDRWLFSITPPFLIRPLSPNLTVTDNAHQDCHSPPQFGPQSPL